MRVPTGEEMICNTIVYAILTSSSEEKWVIITFIFNRRKRNNLYKVICFKLQIYKGLGLHSLQKDKIATYFKISYYIFQNRPTVLQTQAEINTLRILYLPLHYTLTRGISIQSWIWTITDVHLYSRVTQITVSSFRKASREGK